MYYEINEQAARTAHTMNSMREYRANQTTAEYRALVDRAAEIAAAEAARKPEHADALASMLDRYARKLADWFNEHSRLESLCPSIMVSGAGNFPTAKKEKQNRRREAHSAKYNEIQKILDRMKSIGTGGIQSGDADALDKLDARIADLEAIHRKMVETNAYYRKHKTLEGYPCLSATVIAQLTEVMARPWHGAALPFASYQLSNSSANIRRLRERRDALSARKAAGSVERDSGIEGVQVVEDAETMRVKIIFDGKPDEPTRAILKRHGFRWAPSQGAWQRQLTANGTYAAKRAINEIAALPDRGA